MVILHLILHSAVHIHDFHIFITSEHLLIHLRERWREAVERISFLWEYCFQISLKLLTVSNNILLQRLNDLGIRGDIWLWLKNFLTGRRQFVRTNGCDSYTHINSRSARPTLFSLFTNDLPKSLRSAETFL